VAGAKTPQLARDTKPAVESGERRRSWASRAVHDYLASHPNRFEPPRDHVYVQPLGELPAERGPTTDELAAHARTYFGLRVTVLPLTRSRWPRSPVSRVPGERA